MVIVIISWVNGCMSVFCASVFEVIIILVVVVRGMHLINGTTCMHYYY